MKRFLLIALLLVAGCGGTEVVREPAVEVSGAPTAAPVEGAPIPDGAVRIAVVTHGPASSKFWAIIRNGSIPRPGGWTCWSTTSRPTCTRSSA